jgi:superfamily I DNA and RNA helicase
MIDIVFKSVAQSQPIRQLVECLSSKPATGTLYVGYPIYKTADEVIFSDALLTTAEHGVVVFDLSTPAPTGAGDLTSWIQELEDRQDQLYLLLANRLMSTPELTRRRNLAIDIQVITFLPQAPAVNLPNGVLIADHESLAGVLAGFSPLDPRYLKPLNAAIERITHIKPTNKRANVRRDDSRGAILKLIEKEIANLDAWQKKGAIEYPDGPQRIRGLAGSGKTVVLALKAAYLHARHPDWSIGVTFHTRSLYQQFQDLIRRFSFETMNDEPDWKKLRILHSWGGRSEPGVYTEIARAYGAETKDFASAKIAYGSERPFEGVCSALLTQLRNSTEQKTLFNAVLIDEAQDFPGPFFQLVWEVTAKPKRVVFAYDELQNLGEYVMAPTEELFGKDSAGNPRVVLRNEDDRPKQDIILPVCYRNTPWALSIAHALGFGIYREGGLVQMFDEAPLWRDIGYETKGGHLTPGKKVRLARRPDCSPTFFSSLLKPEDAIKFIPFPDEAEQAAWIAQSIHVDIVEQELEPRDILIIIPDAWTARSKAATLMKALDALGHESHLAGVTSSRDLIFVDNSIAITGIYRAKGNEAPMVYVANAEYCFSGSELSKKRNTLFTAITAISRMGAHMRRWFENGVVDAGGATSSRS